MIELMLRKGKLCGRAAIAALYLVVGACTTSDDAGVDADSTGGEQIDAVSNGGDQVDAAALPQQCSDACEFVPGSLPDESECFFDTLSGEGLDVDTEECNALDDAWGSSPTESGCTACMRSLDADGGSCGLVIGSCYGNGG